MKKTIWANVIVKNEDRFIWFAIKSVVDYVDKLLIWDTGSSDETVEIIKLLQREYPSKIIFKEIGEVDEDGLTKARQKMLAETKSEWLLILDGDEIWWKKSIAEVIDTINQKGEKLDAIVSPVINIIGDLFHYQEDSAGQYNFLGKKGHFNMRAINRNIPGLHIKGAYPLEGFYDEQEKLIQQKDDKLILVDQPLLHLTHLERSSKVKSKKMKHELGISFPKNFIYPEDLYENPPKIVKSPWGKRSKQYLARAFFETPARRIKRRLWK